MTGRVKFSQMQTFWQDVKTSMAVLSRLPVHARFDRLPLAIWAFPVVGLVISTACVLLLMICDWIGLGIGLSVALAMTLGVMMTGAMHEDGIADTADGFWGGWTAARRLEIMRDSQIGTYGVLALVLVMLARFSALSATVNGFNYGAIIAAAILSRAAMPYVMLLLAPARADGLSVQTGRPDRKAVTLGAGVALALSWALVGFVSTVVAGCVCVVVIAGFMRLAKAKIGGQTGDVLGATQVICELAALAVFIAAV
ncbi:cobalamin-5'-phosphate synthase [Pacificibacter maritimus]|uniref:Adenosylcobinamide-GDP ribazoletransferase n=1 Tax=Pacificibacter maritimus TaxID=762213 RepID=A0A3N4VG80_9RHOB|nr:adenosylcobinamide-GDP ribazoletransferase [Pacificibacter maritimus]RPE71964.1 cobalamin-5'-phosphate synthase [Pacificibacter maritimus]